jgi:hypothetical protein
MTEISTNSSAVSAETTMTTLLNQYQELGLEGWVHPVFHKSGLKSMKELIAQRESIPSTYAEAFTKACEWVKENMLPAERLCKHISSCGLKKLAEEKIGPIPKGVFILAAIHCGLGFVPVTKALDAQNVFFKFDLRSLEKRLGVRVR